MRNSTPLLAAASLLLTLAAAACSSGDPAMPGSDQARLTVRLTDAPGDVAAAWVEITRIYLQGNEGAVDLLDEPTDLIELTELVGTSVVLAEDVELEPGSYGQLRFVIGGAVLEAKDGRVYSLDGAQHPGGLPATGELHCPSCQQSGLKVILPGDAFELEEGETTVTLDFDVSESFGHRAGNSGRWIMRPTIHGTWVAGGDGMGALVTGTVALAQDVVIPACPAGQPRSLEDFVPRATSTTLVDEEGTLLVRNGVTGADGVFVLGPLPVDSWGLGHLAALALDGADLVFEATVTPSQVVIDSGNVTGVSYLITSATCDAPGG
jgi:hypothetical protein